MAGPLQHVVCRVESVNLGQRTSTAARWLANPDVLVQLRRIATTALLLETTSTTSISSI